MENPLNITALNDFIFCPVSIYFHNLYDEVERGLYQTSSQLDGTKAHETVDSGSYSTSAKVMQGLSVYSEKYNLIGKIDVFDCEKHILTERKKKIKTIYDGYIFQIYAQYFALCEMGYSVKRLRLYSMDDNKVYPVSLPEDDETMFRKFEEVIESINNFEFDSFRQTNSEKCRRCIYEPYCDRSVEK